MADKMTRMVAVKTVVVRRGKKNVWVKPEEYYDFTDAEIAGANRSAIHLVPMTDPAAPTPAADLEPDPVGAMEAESKPPSAARRPSGKKADGEDAF